MAPPKLAQDGDIKYSDTKQQWAKIFKKKTGKEKRKAILEMPTAFHYHIKKQKKFFFCFWPPKAQERKKNKIK